MTAAALPVSTMQRVYEAHCGCCEECGRRLPFSGEGVVYDYIRPPAHGGRRSDANLQILCAYPCFEGKAQYDARLNSMANLKSWPSAA